MTDISKCDGENCTKKETCYRWLAEADAMYQSYIYPELIAGTCIDYWEVKTE